MELSIGVLIALVIVIILLGSHKLHEYCSENYGLSPFRPTAMLSMFFSFLPLLLVVMYIPTDSSFVVAFCIIISVFIFNLFLNIKKMPVHIALFGTTLALLACVFTIVILIITKKIDNDIKENIR